MSTATHPSAVGLALLASKCAPKIFDLSSGMVHASIRDQLVRAQLLIRDLKAKDPECQRILIVGGGVAGVTAACTASDLGIKAVLVDTQTAPFSLQASVHTRFVGPFMYEWPSEGCYEQHYPAPDWPGSPSHSTPRWNSTSPLRASELAQQLKEWLSNHKFLGPEADFFFGCTLQHIKSYVDAFVLHQKKLYATTSSHPMMPLFELPKNCTGRDNRPIKGGRTFEPNYIILAAGMGEERVIHPAFPVLRGKSFWANDSWMKNKPMHSRVGVLGSGDGALQDVLKLITKHEHPLNFIRSLEGSPVAKEELEKCYRFLDHIEQQNRLMATWGGKEFYAAIDHECLKVVDDLLKCKELSLAVRRQLRKGRGAVYHVFSESHFGKAYLLNRFVLHLIERCVPNKREPDRVSYVPLRSTQILCAKKVNRDRQGLKLAVLLSKPPGLVYWDRVIVRYGPNQENLPREQLIKIHPDTQADRISLSGIALPHVVSTKFDQNNIIIKSKQNSDPKRRILLSPKYTRLVASS